LKPTISATTAVGGRAEIDHLVDCVREGRESHCNLEDAIKTHEIAFAALESSKTSQPVRLPLVGEDDISK
jgi:predicted dehydrogenase